MFPLLLAAPLLFAQPQAGLVSAAKAAGRPSECVPIRGKANSAGNIWRIARAPKLQRYCLLLARAHAQLGSQSASAMAQAKAASKLFPALAAPHIVIARAELAADRVPQALASFDRALALQPQGLEQPLALLDLARAQRRGGRVAQALLSYRMLVPRAALLPSRDLRAEALLSAAAVAMTQAGAAPEAERGRRLDEAQAFLREAGRDRHHRHRISVTLALALVHDRAARPQQADALLNQQRVPEGWRSKGVTQLLAASSDGLAIEAASLEVRDRAAAVGKWQAFLDSDAPHAFKEAARQRLKRLQTNASKPRRRAPRRRQR